MSMEIKFLGRWEKYSRLGKNRNNVIIEKINIKNLVLDYIRYKQLDWYGHVQRMNEGRLPRKMLETYPPRRRKGRPQNSWMQGMREKGINNMERIDREEWKRTIKLSPKKDSNQVILVGVLFGTLLYMAQRPEH